MPKLLHASSDGYIPKSGKQMDDWTASAKALCESVQRVELEQLG